MRNTWSKSLKIPEHVWIAEYTHLDILANYLKLSISRAGYEQQYRLVLTFLGLLCLKDAWLCRNWGLLFRMSSHVPVFCSKAARKAITCKASQKQKSISTSEKCKHYSRVVKTLLHDLHSFPQSHVIAQDTTSGTPVTVVHKPDAFSLVVPQISVYGVGDMSITQLEGDTEPRVCDAVGKLRLLIVDTIQAWSDEFWGWDGFFLLFSICIMLSYFNPRHGLMVVGGGKSQDSGFPQGGTDRVRKQTSVPLPPRPCQAEIIYD